MTEKIAPIKNKLTSGALLFAASFFLYSAVSPGNIPGDSEIRWSVARQIVRNGCLYLEEDFEKRHHTVGIDGKLYSFYGLGQSLLMVPFAATGLFIEKFADANPRTSDLAAQFLVSVIMFPAIGALLVWLFYRLIIKLGYDNSIAILVGAVFAFSTMNLHYSVNTHEQTQIALLLVLAILLLVKYNTNRLFSYAWLFCIALGLCLIFRLDSAVMVLPLYLTAAITDISTSGTERFTVIRKWFLAGILGFGGFLILCGWYNFARFGNVLKLGYSLDSIGGHQMFESAPLPTLAAILFSPGKSILLYNPVFLLLIFCYRGFFRKHTAIAAVTGIAATANFIFYSFFTAWAGDYAWSVRYQVPLLPFLTLPLAELFSKQLKTWAKTTVFLVIIISTAIQSASVIYNFNLEFVQNPNHCVIPGSYIWDWSQSHLCKRFENITLHISGKRNFTSVKVVNEEPGLLKFNRTEEAVKNAYNLNFFPFKAKSMLHSKKLFHALSGLWLALLAAFCVTAFNLAGNIAQKKN